MVGEGGVEEEIDRLVRRVKEEMKVKKWRKKEEKTGGMRNAGGRKGRWQGH